MPLASLQFRPGFVKDVTSYTNEGGWIDGDHVRFRMGFPEKIGGWQRIGGNTYIGALRSVHRWTSIAGAEYLGLGTHRKFYVFDGTVYHDITPIRATSAAGDVTFSVISALVDNVGIGPTTTAVILDATTGFFAPARVRINSEVIGFANLGSNFLAPLTRGMAGTTPASHAVTDPVYFCYLQVTHTAHGASAGDFVTFSGAVSLGGAITAGVLNQEYQIERVLDADNYLIIPRAAGTPMSRDISEFPTDLLSELPGSDDIVFANASDTGDGGVAVVGTYQISAGLEHSVLGNGWGAGPWSDGGWGDPASSSVQGQSATMWRQDNFGEILLASRYGGSAIYYWNPPDGFSQRLRTLQSLVGANDTPTICMQVMVSQIDRHVLAFGTNAISSSALDSLLVRFSDQESLIEWEPTALTTAGDLRLGAGSTFITAVQTRQQVLVFTDVALYAMQFIGPPFTFGLTELAFGTSIIGPMAAIAVRDQIFWMGYGNFYAFNGQVQELACPVRDHVFLRLNESQKDKTFAAHNSRFSEVWWFYPSSDGLEIDSYVVFNYEQNIWYTGSLSRTAWIDRGRRPTPIAFADGRAYDHEVGADADGEPLPSFIESAPIDMDDGHSFVHVSRVIPDITFRNSAGTPSVDLTVNAFDRPGELVQQDETRTVTQSTALPVETYTRELYTRLRGRSFSIRIDSDDLGVLWRLGTPRIDIRPDGRR